MMARFEFATGVGFVVVIRVRIFALSSVQDRDLAERKVQCYQDIDKYVTRWIFFSVPHMISNFGSIFLCFRCF